MSISPQLFAILAKTPYGHEKKGMFGIDQLLAEGVFTAAFPLHDVRSGAWLLGRGVLAWVEAEFLAEEDPGALPPMLDSREQMGGHARD